MLLILWNEKNPIFGIEEHIHREPIICPRKTPKSRFLPDYCFERFTHTSDKYGKVARATQQTGFRRVKRGYKQLRLREEMAKEMREPTDPYFPYQWYLVSAIHCLSIFETLFPYPFFMP
ncbi:hypothetical protein CEXT_549281 [Caerostris extrusa]|uniref:Uncharacterized protein n=1 Tax=Caerostris extrusa TaxID=172846 RepID=A0AAV4VN73_CAEEX|nr:hypothetical protein CEXT_549281 [Caerostris extrusa]